LTEFDANEEDIGNVDFTLSLVHFDWFYGKFTKVTSYEKRCIDPFIHVSTEEPSEFVLTWLDLDQQDWHIQLSLCNVIGKDIIFGQTTFIAELNSMILYSFYEGCLVYLKFLTNDVSQDFSEVSLILTTIIEMF
jgi:hypothetical protein